MITAEGLIATAECWTGGAHTVGIVRLGRAAYNELMRGDTRYEWRRTGPLGGPTMHTGYGWTLILDTYLPDPVVRLCAPDDTLLYDSRQGTPG